MPYVLFSIDRVSDVHTLAKFIRYIDTLEVMNKTRGRMKLCFGSWEGMMEQSFIMRQDDFDTFVRNSGYVTDQASFLHVPDDVRQPCVLEYQDGSRFGVGPMRKVTKDYAMMQKGWTYRPDIDCYYVAE
jgi:hypothetical protein